MCDSDWLNSIHFSRYKYKIRLVSVLRKREDQALISISTILKFSVRSNIVNFKKKFKYPKKTYWYNSKTKYKGTLAFIIVPNDIVCFDTAHPAHHGKQQNYSTDSTNFHPG